MHTHHLTWLALLCLPITTEAQILTGVGLTFGGGGVDEPVVEYMDDDAVMLDCGLDSSGLIPLDVLGTDYYETYEGGLFKAGSNEMPYAHLDKGKKISNNLKRRDELGNIDPVDGTIMMIGMGASTASDAYNNFRDTMLALDWPGVNPCLEVKSVFIGGKDMGDILNPDVHYWDLFHDRLEEKFIDPDQIQIVWMMLQSEAESHNMETYITYVIGEYKLILADMLTNMPNLRQVYITGMHYTGYTLETHERYDAMVEPKAYWGNIAIRELINKQIDSDPDLDFEGADRKVPYITWGPYYWADGSNPRATDGLTWTCDEFRSDSTGGGFHLKEEFQYKEGQMLRDFFETSEVTSIWFNDGPKWADCGTGRIASEYLSLENDLQIFPNPTTDQFSISIPEDLTGMSQLIMYDLNGKLIYEESFDASLYSTRKYQISNLPVGIYSLRIADQDTIKTGRIVIGN